MNDDVEDELMMQIIRAHIDLFWWLGSKLPLEHVSFLLVYVRFHRPEWILIGLVLFVGYLAWERTPTLIKRSRSGSGSGVASLVDVVKPLAGVTVGPQWELDAPMAAVFALQGRRGHMEDRFALLSDDDRHIHLCGIFDGHGGESVASLAEQRLFPSLMKAVTKIVDEREETNDLLAELSSALKREILTLDTDLLNISKENKSLAGSTALVAVIVRQHLIVANVGDSRGVLCDGKNQMVPLSFDHKPQQLKEHRRIKEAGGFITFNGVWRVAGVLATSRALGDYPLKDRNLVTAEADVLTFDLLQSGGHFMVLASDGLWDIVSNEECVQLLLKDDRWRRERLKGSRTLALGAYQLGSQDNITVIVVDFHKYRYLEKLREEEEAKRNAQQEERKRRETAFKAATEQDKQEREATLRAKSNDTSGEERSVADDVIAATS